VDDDIPALLSRWPDAAEVRLPRVDFGFSGHRTPPAGLAIEAYTEVADVFRRDPSKPSRVKTILQPRAVSAIGIHTATLADAPISADGRPVPTETIGKACHEFAQLNHYYTRSFEEFEAKRFRGSATGRIARPAIPYELPALRVDVSASRFADRTRATIERLRSLDASPYHYGSQLALSQFPRFNDLGLFGEFAVANTVAEESEPRREPRLRIENQHRGTGFVGDISDTDHRPGRGELSESLHLLALLERSHGRVERAWGSDADEVQQTIVRGALAAHEAGWSLRPDLDGSEVAFAIDPKGRRRCYALGFVVRPAGATRLRLELSHDDASTSEPVDVKLDAATTYAGVVEFDASPSLVTAARVLLENGTAETLVHDLFVISYG